MRRCVVLALASFVACGQGRTREPSRFGGEAASSRAAPQSPAATYADATVKSIHNAYARAEPIFDQLAYHRLRSLELDVHVTRAGRSAPPSEWFVFHVDAPLMRDSSCATLASCLGQVAAFHEAVPQHEVLTLFVDLKDRFGPGHTPADLDAALAEALGPGVVVSPRELARRCEGARDLRDAVAGACTFPLLDELRGRIVVAVTGGSLCSPSPVTEYAGRDATSRLAFVAPDLGATCPVERYDARPDVVMLNMPFAERARAAEVRARGLVARLYGGGLEGGLDTAADFAEARSARAQLLATDRVNVAVDPWATTTRAGGGPPPARSSVAARSERAELLGLRAATGELGGASDDVYFAYRRDEGASRWSAFVSVPSSHVTPMAKGCLMARASERADAPTVALCRPLDDGPPRFFVRHARGARGWWAEMHVPDGLGVTPETPAFLRMTMTPEGRGTDVLGEASVDGRAWTPIARATVASDLPLRGVAMASAGAPDATAIFGRLTRATESAPEPVTMSSLASRAPIGRSEGELFDGDAAED